MPLFQMTPALTILFLSIIDPSVAKWSVPVPEHSSIGSTVDKNTTPIRLEEAEFPSAQFSPWLKSRSSGSWAGGKGQESLLTTWLAKKSKNQDVEPVSQLYLSIYISSRCRCS